MPTRETNITYFFPSSNQSKQEAIERNRKEGRQWVTTSIQMGHQRMKFCTFDNTPDPHKPIYYVAPPSYPKGRIPYQGKEK